MSSSGHGAKQQTLPHKLNLRREVGVAADAVGRVFAFQDPDIVVGPGLFCVASCTQGLVASISLGSDLCRQHIPGCFSGSMRPGKRICFA